MMAELRFYGVDIPTGSRNHRDDLEKALINARRGFRDENVVRDFATQQQQGEGGKFESLLRRLLDDDHQVAAIDLSGCHIGDVGTSRLADALSDNNHVRQLWLRGCAIGNAGAKALAFCLEQNMSIVDLFLADNNIGDEGLVAISDALASSNSTLISLEFDYNDVAEDGLDAFIHSLTMNSTLLVASFENNPRLAWDSFKKINIVKDMLAEKRNNFELFDFVVDLNADDVSVSNLDASSGFVDRSVCSSYMPSTSMSVGGTCQARGEQSNLKASVDSTDSAPTKMGSFRFSIYNKSFRMATKFRIKTPKVFRRTKWNLQSSSRQPPSLSNNKRSHITIPLKKFPSRSHSSLGTESMSTNGLDRSCMQHIRHRQENAKNFGYRAIPLVKYRNSWRRSRWQSADLSSPNDALLQSRTTIAESIKHPETQNDFNTVVTQLWWQIETMKSENRVAAEHYRARHVWFWYVPISATLLAVTLLSLASALELVGKFPVNVENSGYFRLGLGISCVFFSCVAFGFNSTQSKVGWSTHASIHRSIEVELDQVAFRLDKLGKYNGRGLTFGAHSMRGRVEAVRELYRLDFYLQTIQRCSPPIPRRLHEIFRLFARRLKRIHAIKMRILHGGESSNRRNGSDPVPLDMHFDALDLLGQEIEKFYFYPLFIPEAQGVVTRTIDKVFFRNREGNDNDDNEEDDDDKDDEDEDDEDEDDEDDEDDDDDDDDDDEDDDSEDDDDDKVPKESTNSCEDNKEKVDGAPLSKASLLLTGWVEGIDLSTSKKYYDDQKTGTSSSERPESEGEMVDTLASAANPIDTSATELDVVEESSVVNATLSTKQFKLSEDDGKEITHGDLEKMGATFNPVSMGVPANPFEAKDPARGEKMTDGNDAKYDSILPTKLLGFETSTSTLQQQTESLDMIFSLSPENLV